MRQEYTDKMNFYQKPEYETFLKEKHVLDAKQFLHSSMLCLNYALITAQLYKDIGKVAITESNDNPFNNKVDVLGWSYNTKTFLNKLTSEWIYYICNSIDCLLQYVNAALNLGIPVKNVIEKKVSAKLHMFTPLQRAISSLLDDKTVNYIRSANNYSKHTLALYGNTSFTDIIKGQSDISIPDFRFKGTSYNSKTTTELISFYETFIEKYIDILDSVNTQLNNMEPVRNRYHIGEMIINNKTLKCIPDSSGIILHAEFDIDGEHIKRYWIEDLHFETSETIEIMPPYSRTTGQHLGGVAEIEVFNHGTVIGKLITDLSTVETSVLAYHKYKFVAK